MLSPKENWLEAIRFGQPEYVPLGNEPTGWGFQFEGNMRMDDWTNGWGVGWEVGLAGTVPFPKRNPLPSLDRLADYRFPDPDRLVLTEDHRRCLEQSRREGKHIVGSLTYMLFERAWAVMGMDNFLLALVTHPEEAHAYLHGIADYGRRVFARYLDLGVDGVGFSEDLGTQRAPFLSPAMFREFFIPEYRHAFQDVIGAGKVVHFHSCGCVTGIVGDLAALPGDLGGGPGQMVLNPIQHRANDLRRVKAQTLGKIALHGAIDTAVLAMGTVADVRREVDTVMEALKSGGGYVCAPDQGIPGIPEENTRAMWDRARDVGRYV